MQASTQRNWRRRAVVGGAAATAGVIGLGAVAWACTQRIGTFTVCEPPSSVYLSASCAKITGTQQTGFVGGAGGVSNGETISGKASNFKSKNYQVTFRNAGATSDCHRPLTNPGTVIAMPDIATGKTKFLGPSFYKTFAIPNQTTTGAAKICAQDVPDVVTGQVIDLTVI